MNARQSTKTYKSVSIMNKKSRASILLTGFIGGVAFIASCGGEYSNEAIASSIKHQLFCEKFGDSILTNPYNGNVFSASPNSLSCIDSSGNTYHPTDLSQIYNQGWRVQLISGEREYLFSK